MQRRVAEWGLFRNHFPTSNHIGYFRRMTQKKSPPPSSPPPSLPALPTRPATPKQIEASLDARLEFTPVPRATKRWNGLTDLKQRTFIQLLADSGSVTMAAKAIGTTTSAMYGLRRREGAESFAAAWEAAIEIGARRVLDTLMEHAIHGTPETIIQDGEVVAERRKYNHRAMMWIVSQRFPEKYGSATGLMEMSGMSHAMQKLKAKWEGEWRAKYDAEHAAQAEADIEAQEAVLEAERRELLPLILVKMYQQKVREERQYRLRGKVMSADVTLRQLTHLELYMEYAGLTEPEITQFFDRAATDPFPWETHASRAIAAHRIAAWAMDGECENDRHSELVSESYFSPEPVEPEAQPEPTDGQAVPERPFILRPTPLSHGPKGPPHHAMMAGPNMRARTRARDQAEAQMAEAQRLWEACATEESWTGFGGG
jgi:hypothetical protein